MGKFSDYEYRKQPGFDMNTFKGANQSIPMKTVVIHCFDPRAVEIPQAVAEYFGDEVCPGDETVLSDAIAHEVTQPLTAMMANAAAGLRWLDGATPDLDEAKTAFNQIVAAGQRVAAVIERVQAILRKGRSEHDRVQHQRARPGNHKVPGRFTASRVRRVTVLEQKAVKICWADS
ncbi:histidine kinase dimerization/phospho-acceptor domain-containing protein [Paraburkholderia dipogonis]|uniref:histidine kinase n=1 Tax=Paraburkholderia dipogonis TaxID=1211383 RepID=A0ABW9AU13_9BURK